MDAVSETKRDTRYVLSTTANSWKGGHDTTHHQDGNETAMSEVLMEEQ